MPVEAEAGADASATPPAAPATTDRQEARLLEQVNTLFAESGYQQELAGSTEAGGAAEAVKAGTVRFASSLVYGELLTPRTLFGALRLGPRDIFYDLGSGRGQLVLAAALGCGDDITEDPEPRPFRAVGIELLAGRHEAAVKAREVAPAAAQARCEFHCEDALQADVSEATKIYVCNAAFPRPLNVAFSRALAPARTPSLEALATCAALPSEAVAEAGLELAEIVATSATWSMEGAPLYLYRRRGSAVHAGRIDTSRLPPAARHTVERELAAVMMDAEHAAEDERSLLRSAALAASLRMGGCAE